MLQSACVFIIAVDGPAASGKGTLSRKLAERYGLAYLDTGSLYRAVAASVLETGEQLDSVETATRAAENLDLHKINELSIRSAEIGRAAAIVASMPEVRKAVLHIQRDLAHTPPGAVLDGRDIGTVVCPDADVKLFVTASAEIRAHRRWLELKKLGSAISEAQVLADILERDQRDTARAASPLTIADDAHLLDTSNLSIETAFDAAVAIIDGSMS